jgi:hypothetical protein
MYDDVDNIPPKKMLTDVKFGEKLEIDNVACGFKWNYPIINLQSGHVRNCCRTPKQVITEQEIELYGIDVIQNRPYEQDRRREKLLGITHADCESCLRLEVNKTNPPRTGLDRFVNEILIEDKGMYPSKVNDVYRFYLDNVPQTAEQLPYNHPLLMSDKVDMLEIILGNTCDLKCTYCSVHYSSQWVAELIKFGEISKEDVGKYFPTAPEKLEKVFWEWFYDVGRHSTRNINILGGEPTYMPKFYEVMEKLIHAYEDLGKKDRHVELGILSNMNTKEDLLDRFLNYLPKLTKHLYVRLQPSMESIGVRAEYIRQNLSWNRFERNIDYILSNREKFNLNPDNFSMGFQAALNTFSITTLPSFIFWVQSKIEKHQFNLGLYPNLVSFPRHHNPHILPSEYSKYFKIANKFILKNAEKNDQDIRAMRERGISTKHTGSWAEYSSYFLSHEAKSMELQDRSEYDLNSRAYFYDFVQKNKERRGKDFLTIFPEMSKFYYLCKDQYDQHGLK